MQGVSSGQFCKRHGVEKTVWHADSRNRAGGYWECSKCRTESDASVKQRQKVGGVGSSYATKRELEWRRRGMVGLTYEQYQAQATHCKICGSTTDLVPDHDHTTHQFRGVLCSRHNKMLGFAQDDPRVLRCAELYLGGQPCW